MERDSSTSIKCPKPSTANVLYFLSIILASPAIQAQRSPAVPACGFSVASFKPLTILNKGQNTSATEMLASITRSPSPIGSRPEVTSAVQGAI